MNVTVVVDYVNNTTRIEADDGDTLLWMISYTSILEGHVAAQLNDWNVVQTLEIWPPKKPGLLKRFNHWLRCGRHL